MYRTKRLVIRLHKAEHEIISRLARVERLPASTLARRLLLHEAERRGLLPPAGQGDAAAQAGQFTVEVHDDGAK